MTALKDNAQVLHNGNLPPVKRPLSDVKAISLTQCLNSVAEIADYCAANAAVIDHNGAFPVQEFQRIASAGLLAVPLISEFGGLGLGIDASLTHELLILLKKIGWGNLAVGRIFEGHVNALQLIQTFGTLKQIEHYAHAARSGMPKHRTVSRLFPLTMDDINYRAAKPFVLGQAM